MILYPQSGPDFDNLKSAAICNRSETLYSQGFAAHPRFTRNLAVNLEIWRKSLFLNDFTRRPRFWRNSPHYMWVKPQAFRPHVDGFSPAPIFQPRTGGYRP
jgi:hypothetical protein